MDHQKQVDVLITLLEVTVSLLKGKNKSAKVETDVSKEEASDTKE